ncbi:MAG TPA: NFACT family protein [Methylomusa anaerophila]|uniref:Rqc2 homolog RqcH n=1 Tax=Methylomusa anaerophila TaxID=1930071 RepID=A0A348APL8_9FIRM|nr:NFACT family protein [Methylomusa anaerophila]BBB93016.1 hypothetical protein MAMMFC1_03725 [Methylomusa anaerophila]HML87151.1 NFACT family protein [Methylomusa anaerophila]
MSLDGLSLAPLVAEIHNKLAGGRVEKIFQPEPHSLLLWLRQPGASLRLMISVNPERSEIHLTETLPENPATPPNFCMLLRKHLEDGRVAGVCQHSLDRIVVIAVDVLGERGVIVTKQLVVELMGKHSNIILLQDNLIIDSIKRVGFNTSRYRQVLPGREYVYPPGQDRINLFSTPVNQFVQHMVQSNSGNSLAKAIMNTAVGLGPLTAKEIAWRAGFSADIKVNDLDEADMAALHEAVLSVIEPMQSGSGMVPNVVMDSGRAIGIAAFLIEHLKQYTTHRFDTMSAAVEFFSRTKGRPVIADRDILKKLLTTELTRLTKKQGILTQEIAEAEQSHLLKKYADILMANLYNIPPGIDTVTLYDFYNDSPDCATENAEIVIPLEPSCSPLENAQNYYHKYNKAKRARETLEIQLGLCRDDILYLESIAAALENAENSAEVSDIRQELISAGYIKEAGKRRLPAAASQPLTVKTTDGFSILIGKNNRQNDLVTFKHSSPHDIWLHTKDIPGSHVILRTENKQVSDQALSEAALLAAYYSKARHSATVPVDYTRRKHVRKPSGAKPGFVYYENQTTIFVTPDETAVTALINNN